MPEQKPAKIIDLQDLKEDNFLNLIAAKNQDKRFYHWLHMHPLFAASDGGSDEDIDAIKDPYQNRRLSEQINLKSSLLQSDKFEMNNKEDADMEFFKEMYAGVPALFEEDCS